MTPSTATDPSDPKPSPMTRMVWELAESAHAPEQRRGKLAKRRLVVLGGDPSTAANVCDELSRAGAVVFPLDGRQTVDGIAGAAAAIGHFDGIIDLNLATTFAMDDSQAWETPFLQTVRLLQSCYDDWLEE